MDAVAGWHAVKDQGDSGLTNDAGSSITMPSSYASTPARAPVTWDEELVYGAVGFSTGGTALAARSWTFTITNSIGQVANMGGSAAPYALSQRGGFYAEDLDMELSIVVPSEDSAWIKRRIADSGLLDVTTTIDNIAVRWGSCRLAMDQSPMTSTAGYDETLVFKVGTFKYTVPGTRGGEQTRGAPAEGRTAGTDLDVETGLPSGDEDR